MNILCPTPPHATSAVCNGGLGCGVGNNCAANWYDLDGTFSNGDVGSGGGISLPGCRWESAGANGAIARMRVNFDVPAVAGAA